MRKLTMDELNRLSVEEAQIVERVPITVVLDNVRSLLNVGSIFRTCDAFRIEKIVLCGITGKPPHREIQKTALGATETVPWEYIDNVVDAISTLKKTGYQILIAEQTDKSIYLNNWENNHPNKYAVVFGNEIDGISETILLLADTAIEIPQYGNKHSLNIAVAAGIILYELSRKTLIS